MPQDPLTLALMTLLAAAKAARERPESDKLKVIASISLHRLEAIVEEQRPDVVQAVDMLTRQLLLQSERERSEGVPCPVCADDCEQLVSGLWFCGTCGMPWTLAEVSEAPER